MRLASCLGFGKEQNDKRAYKNAEMQAQREDASEFLDETKREAKALINRLKAQARLRGGGEDNGHPRTSH